MSEAANLGDLKAGEQKNGSLLLILGSSSSEDQTKSIFEQALLGLRCWSAEESGQDLDAALRALTQASPFANEKQKDGALIRHRTDALQLTTLCKPTYLTLRDELLQFVTHATKFNLIVYAGKTVAGSGDWLLPDGLFTEANLATLCQERKETQTKLRLNVFSPVKLAPRSDLHAFEIRTEISPHLNGDVPGAEQFLRQVRNALYSSVNEETFPAIMSKKEVQIRRPSLFVFPAGHGDASMFSLSGFNFLINGGFEKPAALADLFRSFGHLDGALITHLSPDAYGGLLSFIEKSNGNLPLGHVFMNAPPKRPLTEAGGKELSNSLSHDGNELVHRLRELHVPVQNVQLERREPITLYQKLGQGKLDMYILSPLSNSKELADLMQQWSKNLAKFSSERCGLVVKDLQAMIPITHLASTSAIFIWTPACETENIVRLLFPGNAPQHKLIEGLERFRELLVLKKPTLTPGDLTKKPNGSGRKAEAKKPATAPPKPLVPKAPAADATPAPKPAPRPKTAPAPSATKTEPRISKTGQEPHKAWQEPHKTSQEPHKPKAESKPKPKSGSQSARSEKPIKGIRPKTAGAHPSPHHDGAAGCCGEAAANLSQSEDHAEILEVKSPGRSDDGHASGVADKDAHENGNHAEADTAVQQGTNGHLVMGHTAEEEIPSSVPDVDAHAQVVPDLGAANVTGFACDEMFTFGPNDLQELPEKEVTAKVEPTIVDQPLSSMPLDGHASNLISSTGAELMQFSPCVSDEIDIVAKFESAAGSDQTPEGQTTATSMDDQIQVTNDIKAETAEAVCPADEGAQENTPIDEHEDDPSTKHAASLALEESVDKDFFRGLDGSDAHSSFTNDSSQFGTTTVEQNFFSIDEQDFKVGASRNPFEAYEPMSNFGQNQLPASSHDVQVPAANPNIGDHQGEPTDWSTDPTAEWPEPMGLPSPPPPEEAPSANGQDAAAANSEEGATAGKGKAKSADATGDGPKKATVTKPKTNGTKPPVEKSKSDTAAKKPPPPPQAPREPAKKPPAIRPPAAANAAVNTTHREARATLNNSIVRTEKPPADKPSAEKSEKAEKSDKEKSEKPAPPKIRPSIAPIAKPPITATPPAKPVKLPALPRFSTPFYVEIAYIPAHGDPAYANEEFFKRIRAKRYILSGLSHEEDTLNSFLAGIHQWDEKDRDWTVFLTPTYESESLRKWQQSHHEELGKAKVVVEAAACQSVLKLDGAEMMGLKVEF